MSAKMDAFLAFFEICSTCLCHDACSTCQSWEANPCNISPTPHFRPPQLTTPKPPHKHRLWRPQNRSLGSPTKSSRKHLRERQKATGHPKPAQGPPNLVFGPAKAGPEPARRARAWVPQNPVFGPARAASRPGKPRPLGESSLGRPNGPRPGQCRPRPHLGRFASRNPLKRHLWSRQSRPKGERQPWCSRIGPGPPRAGFWSRRGGSPPNSPPGGRRGSGMPRAAKGPPIPAVGRFRKQPAALRAPGGPPAQRLSPTPSQAAGNAGPAAIRRSRGPGRATPRGEKVSAGSPACRLSHNGQAKEAGSATEPAGGLLRRP